MSAKEGWRFGLAVLVSSAIGLFLYFVTATLPIYVPVLVAIICFVIFERTIPQSTPHNNQTLVFGREGARLKSGAQQSGRDQ